MTKLRSPSSLFIVHSVLSYLQRVFSCGKSLNKDHQMSKVIDIFIKIGMITMSNTFDIGDTVEK